MPDDVPDGLEPPDWLNDFGVDIWAEFAPDLEKKGVLTSWDTETFAILCDTAARRRKAAMEVEASGEVIEATVYDRNGKPTGTRRTRNPWLIVLNQADAQMLSWAARFGMTPSDRSQLGGGAKARDPYDDLLTG